MDGATLGARIRQARQARGLSLRNLASRVGVSASMLSQMETGKTLASVSTLRNLVTELGISLDELFRAEPAPVPGGGSATGSTPGVGNGHSAAAVLQPGPVHDGAPPVLRAGTRQTLEMAGGVTWERLSSLLGQLVDVQLVTYRPGSSSSTDGQLMRHNGAEFAYLIEGHLTLTLGYETYSLTAGDSVSFDSTIPHVYANHGSVDARGVWFEVGRRVVGSLERDWAGRAIGGPPGLAPL